MEQVGSKNNHNFTTDDYYGFGEDNMSSLNYSMKLKAMSMSFGDGILTQEEGSEVNEEEFEVKLDEDLLQNEKRKEFIDSKVLQHLEDLEHQESFPEKRGRVTSKRMKKKLKDFSGYLLKKSGSIFKGWQKRYVYLSDKRLGYYIKETDTHPQGIINFEVVDAKLAITRKEQRKFTILVDGSKRKFQFKAPNQEVRNQWGSEIIKHIVETNDSSKKDIDFSKENKFWKQCDKINEETFIKEADSGDILLFKGKAFGSKITRRLTNSEYDHVAMVLTFLGDDDIYLLEATSEGVHVINWSQLSRYKEQLYTKIVWRRLYCERDENFGLILETFVHAVEDKKYKISLAKLLKRKSIMPRTSQLTSSKKLIDENRTFFCSELIAKAFKTLGLLITGKSCTLIYPKHFSAKKKLGLTDSALGEELEIT